MSAADQEQTNATIAIDMIDRKLGLARQLGATDAFNAATPDVEAAIKQATGGGIPSRDIPLFKKGKLLVDALMSDHIRLD
jgi:Zn-dependent alcohol dehydrogenase